MQEAGICRYHPLEDAAAYRDRLRNLETQIDTHVGAGTAVLAADLFTLDGSLAKGRKMVADLSRLMLRAYNAEADNCVRSLRSGNIHTATKRLTSAMTAIEKLGSRMEMRINPNYHALRVAELELTADFQMKVQQEREQAREERALLREQRRAEQELAAERERLEKEKAHFVTVLESLRANGDDSAAEQLALRLATIDDAIALESELHKAFTDQRVNFVNQRREFFFATPAQVRELLTKKVGGLLEFAENPEAQQYFQSRNRWPHG